MSIQEDDLPAGGHSQHVAAAGQLHAANGLQELHPEYSFQLFTGTFQDVFQIGLDL